MPSLNILSGGAAHGLVATLTPAFKAQTGYDITGEFGAVGVMADKLRSGTAADLIILTAALLAELADEKLVTAQSVTDVGRVETALAVRAGDPVPMASDAARLRDAFRAADAIFVPDTGSSTAGIHVAKILKQLGIAGEVADRLQVFPNGATAMRELAASKARRPIGCTQSTEIISSSGVTLCGALPPGYELATMYTAGIISVAAHSEQARRLIGLLTSPSHHGLRISAGFISGRS
jgi:molybdate transport system substrate-binding protein